MTKTPTPTLYRWALLDKSGKNRGSSTAATKAAAQVNILDQRQEIHGRRISIPKGWTIVKRGPVKDGETVTNLQAGPLTIHKAKVTEDEPTTSYIPTTTPRPFQVGDRVERVGHELFVPVGSKGTVIASDKFSVRVEWEWRRSGSSKSDISSYGIAEAEKFVRLLEPAPQPKAEDLLAAAIEQSTQLAGQFQDAFGMPDTSWPELIKAARFAREARGAHRQLLGLPLEHGGTITDAIKTLKADLEQARLERDQAFIDATVAHGGAEHAEQERAIADRRLRAALEEVKEHEAIFEDVAAIVRVIQLAQASKTEDWTHASLLAEVIGR